MTFFKTKDLVVRNISKKKKKNILRPNNGESCSGKLTDRHKHSDANMTKN